MPNQLEDLTPQMGLQILEVFRENSILPSLVNTDFDTSPAVKGSTIDVNVMRPMSTRPVTPGMVNPVAGMNDVASDNYPVSLNEWEESPFVMTDKEVAEIAEGVRSKSIEEAVRALANRIDLSVIENAYRASYNFVGVPGTTPFANDLIPAQTSTRMLTTGRAPKGPDRHMLLDEFAYASALGNPALQRVDASGSNETLREAVIRRAVGFNWYEDQNVPVHEVGMTAGPYAVDAAATAGARTIVIDDGAGGAPANTPNVGDVFTIAGSTQPYVIESVDAAATELTLGIRPGLAADVADGAAITPAITANHVANLAFHRDAIAFASRPLADVRHPTSIMETISDPLTGVTLRLEISREHKQTTFSVDCLWGSSVPFSDKLVRVLG